MSKFMKSVIATALAQVSAVSLRAGEEDGAQATTPLTAGGTDTVDEKFMKVSVESRDVRENRSIF